MIRLFASDLDGTLFNAFHRNDRTILSAIESVREAGAHFSIATGRTLRDPRSLGFREGVCVVGANGAFVAGEDGHLVRKSPLPPSFVESLLREFPDVPFDLIGADHTYHQVSEAAHAATFASMGLGWRIITAGVRLTGAPEHVYDLAIDRLCSLEICKVNLRRTAVTAKKNREVEAFLAAHADEVVDAPFAPDMHEVTAVGVDKGEALAWLAGHLGLREDEVAVYGDGGNDLAMLGRFAGYGHAYAPANACDDAKRAAGNVIGRNAFHAVPRHMLRTLREQA